MKSSHLTAERARELLSYDPETGIVTHMGVTRWRGRICASKDKDGYLIVSIDGGSYSLARAIFFMQTGRWPKLVDHANRNKTDNRWANLRECGVAGNMRNKGKSRAGVKSRFKGVHQTRSPANPWWAEIYFEGVKTYLGVFPSEELAAQAYDEAALRIHGAFAATNEDLGLLPKLSEAA